MRCWVVIYNHKHGVDAWPLFQNEAPTEDQVKEQIRAETGEFDEEDEREWIEIRGFFDWEDPECDQLGTDLQVAMNRVHLLENIILKLSTAPEVSMNLSPEEADEVNSLVEREMLDEPTGG